MKLPVALWFGRNTSYSYDQYQFVNQTDFEVDNDKTATITELDGLQVIKIYTTSNRGHDSGNTSTNSTIGINDVAAREQVGQTIVVSSDTIYGAPLKLSTVGSPAGTLTIGLYATNNGLPTGSALATGTLSISEINSDEEWHWVKFSSSASVTSGGTHALTVTTSYSTDPNNYVAWSYHTASQITGSQVLYDGNTWSAGAGDQGAVLCSDYFNFQYVKRFVDMSDPSDETGLSEDFDQAIAKMAAGIITANKGKYQESNTLFYGPTGDENRPNQNSAFGILNLLWTNKRMVALRQGKRMKTIYEKASEIGGVYETWPYSSFTNLI